MLGDREKAELYAAEQRRLIRQSVDGEVLRFAPGWSDRARAVGLVKPRTAADLSVLAPTALDDLGRAATLLVRPTVEGIRRGGPPPLRRRVRSARLRGRGRNVGPRIIDPIFKPIHWLIERDVPVGCSETDLVRLAELGRRLLVGAGVGPADAIVSVVPSGPNLGYWQLALGARELGAPLAGLHPETSADAVVLLGPTVLVGRPSDLHALLQRLPQSSREGITTLLAVSRGPMTAAQRATVMAAAWPQTTLVEAWSPPGVRAMWGQCPGGEGVHTWPATELVEVCDDAGKPLDDPIADGAIVWTGLGWRGTAILRLATGLRGHLVRGPCPACRRTTPRLVPVGVEAVRPKRTVAPASVRRILPTAAPLPDTADFAWPGSVLVGTSGIAAWQVEHRMRRGRNELIIHLALADDAGIGSVLPSLEQSIGATQYVIGDVETVERRIAGAGGRRVVDLRRGQSPTTGSKA